MLSIDKKAKTLQDTLKNASAIEAIARKIAEFSGSDRTANTKDLENGINQLACGLSHKEISTVERSK